MLTTEPQDLHPTAAEIAAQEPGQEPDSELSYHHFIVLWCDECKMDTKHHRTAENEDGTFQYTCYVCETTQDKDF
jgi:hypothetical protein